MTPRAVRLIVGGALIVAGVGCVAYYLAVYARRPVEAEEIMFAFGAMLVTVGLLLRR